MREKIKVTVATDPLGRDLDARCVIECWADTPSKDVACAAARLLLEEEKWSDTFALAPLCASLDVFDGPTMTVFQWGTRMSEVSELFEEDSGILVFIIDVTE